MCESDSGESRDDVEGGGMMRAGRRYAERKAALGGATPRRHARAKPSPGMTMERAAALVMRVHAEQATPDRYASIWPR